MIPSLTKTSPPIKTPTHGGTRSYKGTCSAVALPTLLPIAGKPGAATAGREYIKVYSAIAVSACVNIVRKKVINMAEDI